MSDWTFTATSDMVVNCGPDNEFIANEFIIKAGQTLTGPLAWLALQQQHHPGMTSSFHGWTFTAPADMVVNDGGHIFTLKAGQTVTGPLGAALAAEQAWHVAKGSTVVVVNQDCTVVYPNNGPLTQLKAGARVYGAQADFLLATGAPVTVGSLP